ncbi:MAG: hypothetical protein ACJ8J0_20635, partial [Longimicrobiaceae bacterium]
MLPLTAARRLAAAALAPALAAAAPSLLRHAAPPAYDAVVDASYHGVDGARVEGARRYRTVGAALADAPRDPALTYVVFIRAGRY